MTVKLAIFGGNPISSKKLTKPSPIGKQEIGVVTKIMEKGILSRAGRGVNVKNFEKRFAQFHGLRYAVSTTSGTTALHTAIAALNIKENDEVLVPDLTFVSSASVILQQKAVPVFVDIDPKTFCIDTIDLEKKITKRTKAIIIVHLYGHPAEMNKIKKIAKKYNFKIIEDCAQAVGAKYKGRYVGTFGDIACFSFYQTKNLTCGEGGMVITNNKKLFCNCCSIVDHGLVNGNILEYDYDRLGYNYHLSEIQAAIGIEQLKKLKNMNRRRKANADKYRKLLKDTNLEFQNDSGDIEHAYYVLTALLPENFKNDRDWFVDAVRSERVEINKIYPNPLHKTKLFSSFHKNKKYPVTSDITSRLFNFYTTPGITNEYIELTCRAVKKVLDYLSRSI
ncbi:MAG: DegT/DnrJ/EryC1/StrS family aminotransferase [Patescibacteria group bacterium]|jgi:dTDP-4-amino-4,6-dideoxygalactose transaminase